MKRSMLDREENKMDDCSEKFPATLGQTLRYLITFFNRNCTILPNVIIESTKKKKYIHKKRNLVLLKIVNNQQNIVFMCCFFSKKLASQN